MSLPRAGLITLLATVLFGLGTTMLGTDVRTRETPSGRPHAGATARLLPLLVSEGRAPGAALLARTRTRVPAVAPAPAPTPAVPLDSAPATAPSLPSALPSALPRSLSASRFEATGPGIRRADRFRAGSITKTLVATVILQLAATGELDLSDTVDQHLPGLVRGHGNDGRALTLRSLLNHTSGLYDYTADHSAPKPDTARAAVRTALSHAPAPVGTYTYSNTDYVLLGMVVKQVTGRSYAAEAERRIIAPLHLTGTSFPGARSTLPVPHGRGYTRTHGSQGPLRDVTDLDPRPAGAAGELISTLDDLNRFFTALLDGELLPESQRRELLNTRATHGLYGMGIFPERLSCGRTVWGHNGRIAGSYVRTAATADGHHTFSFRVDTDTLADDSLETALLEAEFCGPDRTPHPTGPPEN
ncbi:serine hydrolase domain-containing protein [Streptomyces sp. NPDC088725]|uniref:serine hydrolase domain-containing protein n=1 Tax=Streptomyces sp. NPDC088725 TaxID=3365873 RepID=UPI0038153F1F